jgi:stress response protein YsnF
VGRIVDERPVMRETEDTIVIPVVEEIVVVERRLFLKEEIHVRKTRRVERKSEQVTLRTQQAEVLRLPPKGSPVTS